MTPAAAQLTIAATATSVAFVALWWRQTRTANATSVDAAWAVAIGVLGLAAAGSGDGSEVQRLVAGGIVACWSGRLSCHLLRHRVFGHAEEDGRYLAMRTHWGAKANARFFCFYQLQAAVAFVFALPFWFVAQHAPAVAATQVIGIGWFMLAQLAESFADRQLAAHRRDPTQRGRTCRRGLWRLSRHPNYFFEWLSWCGIGAVAWPAAGAWAIVQPAVMLVLVRFVSGVPFTELQALKSRGDDYCRYQQETNAFVPWWPKRGGGDA